MPVTMSFQEPSTFVLRGSGVVTYMEIIDALAKIGADARFGPGSQLLGDGRVAQSAPDAMEIRMLATTVADLHQRGLGRVAVVAERSSVYGASRMFSVFAGMLGVEVSVFRRLDEAEGWLATEPAH